MDDGRNQPAITSKLHWCRMPSSSRTMMSAAFSQSFVHTMAFWTVRYGRFAEGQAVSYLIKAGLVFLWIGNRFANSDYTLAQVFQSQKDQPHIVYSYNLECQHSIHCIAHFKTPFPGLVDIVKCVVGCIPQMHIRNHKDNCRNPLGGE